MHVANVGGNKARYHSSTVASSFDFGISKDDLATVEGLERIRTLIDRLTLPSGASIGMRDIFGGLSDITRTMPNMAPLLPLIFRVDPRVSFSLHNYAQFVPLYNREIPPERLLLAGRQVGKTANLCTNSLLIASIVPSFKQMYVTPLFEQTKRFSMNHVNRMLRHTWLGKAIFDPAKCEHNVLQKSLMNDSRLTFSYCFSSTDRARGADADSLTADEIQDIDSDALKVVRECMSGSKIWRFATYAGTGKTTDNTIEILRLRSSQGEWMIPCRSCRKENIASVAEDMMGMIGPRGLKCAKCGYSLSTRDGKWVHKFPDRVTVFPSWHLPQPIMPQHCENARAWRELLEKLKHDKATHFRNEVLGEAADAGSKLITLEAIKKASSLPFKNTRREALKRRIDMRNSYIGIAIGVDWGGRGILEDSFTAYAVTGLRTDYRAEVLFATKSPPSVNNMDEIIYAISLFKQFRADCIGFDYRGAGEVKDTMFVQRGMTKYLMPWVNESTLARYFAKLKRSPTNRRYVSINRGAAIQLLAHELNGGRLFLPQFEQDSTQNMFLDLNSWMDNYIARPDGTNLYQVLKSACQPDDVGWAIIYSLFSLYRRKQHWPTYMSSLTERGIIEAENKDDDGDDD